MTRWHRLCLALITLFLCVGPAPAALGQTPPVEPPGATATARATPILDDVNAPATDTPATAVPTAPGPAVEALDAPTVPPTATAPTATAPITVTGAISATEILTATAPTATAPITTTRTPEPEAGTAEPAALPEVGETITPLITPTVAETLTLTETAALSEATSALTGMDAQVESLLARMSVADRVGQLFIVTFEGSDTSFESAIAELIYAYRVGGVVVTPENSNISNEPGSDTATQMAVLANKLQAIAYGILLPTEVALQPVPNEPWPPSNFVSLEREIGVTPPNLPLLIGVQQMGDNLPATALRRGFTQLPSPLAIGSTWDPETARQIGVITGRELRAVGANLLMGPQLDVMGQPATDLVGSLGVFSFGGNADWVSRMGRAYIQGVHEGSQDRVATVAGHFPGQGDIDRLPDDEVATIQRGADELQRLALPPFVAVTQAAHESDSAGALAVSDVLMTSHMRFRALQATSGRNTPLSLDPELNTLVNTWMGDWRAQGGLLMSGPLGVAAIRTVYDATQQDFPARRVALDAFTAGHDLLYLAHFAPVDNWDRQLDNYRATIAFFQERYRNDPDFAAHVDNAVRRILRLKLRLYGSTDGEMVTGGTPAMPIPLSQVLVQQSDLRVLPGEGGEPDPAPDLAARESATLLYPDPATTTLPPPPQGDESIVIVTDSRLQRECSTCLAEPAVDPDAIARIILSLYGPEATGQISPDSITSLTFSDLAPILRAEPGPVAAAAGASVDAAATPPAESGAGLPVEATAPGVVLPTPTPTPLIDAGAPPESPSGAGTSADLEATLANADWLIFAMLDVNVLHPNSEALRRYLRQRSDPQGEQQLVVLGLNAPYFLDATEISKLSLYYGIYSKTSPFLESAVRALFRSYTPTGAPAVSAPGTRFGSLADRLAPDPATVVPLGLGVDETLVAGNAVASAGGGVQTTGPAVVNVGQTLRFVAGPVLDLNGHPVPDGQPVAFEAKFEGAELGLTIEPALTSGGVATREVMLERGGVLGVVARAGAATSGEPVVVTVLEPQAALTPTLALAGPPTPTPTLPAVAAVPPPTGPVTATAANGGGTPPTTEAGLPRIDGVTLLLSLLTMLLALSLLLLVQIRVLPRETLFKSLLWAMIAGLAAYLLYAQGWLPGSRLIAESFNVLGAPLVVFVAMLLPLFWLQLRGGGER